MFGSRRYEAVLAALQAENSDLRAQLRAERAQAADERQSLVDRVLAVESPRALREVRRAPTQEPGAPPEPRHRRPRYPSEGGSSLRPPSPPSPPIPGAVSFTDLQRFEVLSKATDTLTAKGEAS